MKRSRGRGRRGPPNNQSQSQSHSHGHNRPFDSAGPEVKIRGTAANIYEKYLQLARDAGSAGDRVAQENYLQHAEHYYRIMMANQAQLQQQGGYQQQGQAQQQGGQQGNYQQPQYAGQSGQPADGHQGNGPPSYGQPQPVPGSGPSFSLAERDEADEADADADEAAAQ